MNRFDLVRMNGPFAVESETAAHAGRPGQPFVIPEMPVGSVDGQKTVGPGCIDDAAHGVVPPVAGIDGFLVFAVAGNGNEPCAKGRRVVGDAEYQGFHAGTCCGDAGDLFHPLSRFDGRLDADGQLDAQMPGDAVDHAGDEMNVSR